MTAAPGLEFSAESHTYNLGGARLPSVTQVIGAVMGPVVGVDLAVYHFAGERGSYVHDATEQLEDGLLDWRAVHPALVPYVKAYEKFLTDTGWTSLAMEERVVGPYGAAPQYAGTIDRRGFFPSSGAPTIIDLKTSTSIQRQYGIQLAAYEMTQRERHRRYVVQLRKDGTYRVKEFAHPDDGDVFLAMLKVSLWRGA